MRRHRSEGAQSGPRRMAGPGVASALALLTLALAPRAGRADLVITAPTTLSPADADSSGNGSFNVYLSDTDPAGSAPYDIGGFGVNVSATDSNGQDVAGSTFVFETVDAPASGYIFGDDGGVPPGGDLTDTMEGTIGGPTLQASDIDFSATGYQEIDPGQSLLLAVVTYQIAPAAGTVYLNYVDGDAGASNVAIVDPNSLNAVLYNATSQANGTVELLPLDLGPEAVVPEPSSLATALVGVGVALLAGFRRRLGLGRA